MSSSEKVLLLVGASSDIGIALLQDIIENYSLVYAHYNSHKEGLLSLKERYKERLCLICDDFRKDTAGKGILDVIDQTGLWPDHLVHLTSEYVKNIRFRETEWKDFCDHLDVSLRSAVTITGPIISKMVKEKKQGRIVYTLSSYIEGMPPKYMSPYIVSKYALLGLMKTQAAEYCNKGIAINGISPEMVETKFLKNIDKHVIEGNALKNPLKRNLSVAEVVPTMKWLLSDGAARITGQNIIISGGM